MEDEVTPEALRPSRLPESILSPPLPPPTFNPPAELPPDPAVSISPPPSTDASPQSSASSPGPWMSSFEPPASPASGTPRRPDLRAVQRVSDDVILSSPGTGSQGSVVGSPVGSEGGEHLQEMRERLLSESSSAGSSRRDSETSNSSTPRSSMDVHVTAPTPPSIAENNRESPSPEAGPSRLGASPLSSHSPQLPSLDAVVEHKWDSVWPATVQPRPLSTDDKLPPFSPAPISPFVTPTFSAPAPLVTRKAVSPTLTPGSPTTGRPTSPVRFSPRSMSAAVDAAPATSTMGRSPTQPSPSRHSRAQSSGSTLMRPSIEHRPLSPPLSPISGDMLASTSQQRINDSLSRRGDQHSPPMRARTGSSSTGTGVGSGSRPRRTSFNDAPQSFRLSPDVRANKASPSRVAVKEDDIPPLPPTNSSFGLPPAVASPPFTLSGDDGSISTDQMFSPPLVAPLARPAALRRALSDYDTTQRPNSTQFHRTLSLAAELDQSPKRPEAIGKPETIPESAPVAPADGSPKSPKLDAAAAVQPEATTHPPDAHPKVDPDYVGDVNLVDEGDVLPTGDYQMDVTFDDEGLNTLERIFLLSQSDFGFHRAYVARVLGDLLEDVDPCESVEYVLPLLNGYSVDEDETVKEAFSSELHRILWYFFSTCRLTSEPGETMTITSEGIEYVTKPTLEEMPEIPAINMDRRPSIISAGGPSSAGSSLTNPRSSLFDHSDTDTPNSVTSVSSDQTAFSPMPWVDANIDGDSAKEPAQLVSQPELPINTFTPLLGNLMLSPNPVVGDHTRDAIIAVIGRLRGNADPEKWVRASGDQDKRKTFISQNGLHAHDLRPFPSEAKIMVETELVNGIVLGMGRLSTELPEQYFEDDENRALSDDGEAFKLQLIQEAESGRAISLYLIGSLCDVYAGQIVVDKGFLDEVLRSTDGDETTRTEGAVALSRLAKIVPVENIQPMLPVFTTFATDESESVRQAVAVALPALAKRIESLDSRRTFAVDGIEALMRDGVNCRCSALEVLGELIYLFNDDPNGPPQQLLEIYLDDSQSGTSAAIDRVWDIIATFNFPGVCLTLGAERWPELRELFHRLQERGTDKVLTTIASFLHELAKILKPEQVAEDLLPVYTRLIDAKDDIRERVFEHADVFVAGLPAELGWMTFLGLAEAWKCDTLGGWRAREAVALHIPAFLELFVARDIDVSPILQMTSSALLDKFAAVRDAAIKGIPQSYITLNGTGFAAPFRDMLLDLSTASSYRQRVTFTRCLREFVKPPPHRGPFEEFFAPALPRLRTDVVDVRIALAQIVADLFVVGAYYATDTEIPPVITQLAQALAEDDATDVRDSVRNIDLDRLRKGKSVRRESVDIEDPKVPDRPTSTTDQSANDKQPQIMRRSSAEVPGKRAAGLSAQRNSDPDLTPRFNDQGSEPSSNLAVDPFATSFTEAVNETETDTQDPSPSGQ